MKAVWAISAILAGALLAQDTVIRVSDAEAKKAAQQMVSPEYPVMAKQMRISGRAVVEAHIDTDGKVDKVEPVSGNPLLTSAAVSAVKKWKFSPFQSAGKPTRAVTALSFEFKI